MHQCMHINSLSVLGRFDLSVYHCVVAPVITHMLQLCDSSRTTTVQAEYGGTYFITDVTVEVRTANCDLIIGKEWVALLHRHVYLRRVHLVSVNLRHPAISQGWHSPLLLSCAPMMC